MLCSALGWTNSIGIERHTAIIESGNNDAAACSGAEDKTSLEDTEDGETLGILEDMARDNPIETVVAAVDKGLEYLCSLCGLLLQRLRERTVEFHEVW